MPGNAGARAKADKGPGVVLGLIVRAEDSDNRSDSQENDSRPLIVAPDRPEADKGPESFLGLSFGLRIATIAPTVKKMTPVPLSLPSQENDSRPLIVAPDRPNLEPIRCRSR